jgi:hypothetical protein
MACASRRHESNGGRPNHGSTRFSKRVKTALRLVRTQTIGEGLPLLTYEVVRTV